MSSCLQLKLKVIDNVLFIIRKILTFEVESNLIWSLEWDHGLPDHFELQISVVISTFQVLEVCLQQGHCKPKPKHNAEHFSKSHWDWACDIMLPQIQVKELFQQTQEPRSYPLSLKLMCTCQYLVFVKISPK